MVEDLVKIHQRLKFNKRKELGNEIPEQLMAVKHIRPDDVVLEFGASIGRNTCVISSLLNDSSNLVTIEPSEGQRRQLMENRDANSFQFEIEPCVLSTCPLYSRGWSTYKNPVDGSVRIPCISWDELKKKYNRTFNVFIIDNEGNFVENLKAFPQMLEGVRLLSIEHDFHTEDDLRYFYVTMKQNGFHLADVHKKTDKYGPGMNWSDGLRVDPIFVSVWKK